MLVETGPVDWSKPICFWDGTTKNQPAKALLLTTSEGYKPAKSPPYKELYLVLVLSSEVNAEVRDTALNVDDKGYTGSGSYRRIYNTVYTGGKVNETNLAELKIKLDDFMASTPEAGTF